MNTTTKTNYRVLARKYRPTRFDELVGQDTLVHTLSNAIYSDRLPHAWVMTGVRGVGKTSAARIIARSINCIGEDGKGKPTPNPCNKCEHCISITQDRHVDVIEMDAASRTGVSDIREIIESVQYRPTSARYKVYIIDEVHMLSGAAFNALLKTLEEPPPHVKFVFATTEIRKLPITVLSRCQRFDLQRVSVAQLQEHFSNIAEQEKVKISDTAIQLIANAADGSVRDGLSLLDQAITISLEEVSEDSVKKMLGLTDRIQTFSLFEEIMRGKTSQALDQLEIQYQAGIDPVIIIRDLLEVTHWVTRLKISPEIATDPSTPELERTTGLKLCESLSISVLTRAWQILLKGLDEVRFAPNSMQAAEMIIIRLTHASTIPTPADIIKKITKYGQETESQRDNIPTNEERVSKSSTNTIPISSQKTLNKSPQSNTRATELKVSGDEQAIRNSEPLLEIDNHNQFQKDPVCFQDLADLAKKMKEPRLNYWLNNDVHLVHFHPSQIEIRIRDGASDNLVTTLGQCLKDWTGKRWVIAISDKDGEKTLSQQKIDQYEELCSIAAENKIVKEVIDRFPGSKIKDIKPNDKA